jgi:hypothetical protein
MTTPNLFDVDPDQAPDATDRRSQQQLLLVLAQSRFSAACKSCGQPMTMAQLVGSGKWMPFDADPVAIRTSLDPQTNKLIEHLDAADVHFRTCPNAATHRRRP